MALHSPSSWTKGALAVGLLLSMAALALAHDMFLKPASYLAPPNSDVVVRLLNGTFSKSENSILRSRIADLSVQSPAGRVRLDLASWSENGDTSMVTVRTGGEGTYLVGVSTRPSTIRMNGKAFNEYLESDGIPDVLAARRHQGTLADSAHERYSKHVKAILQVGETLSADFGATLGYPAELVPLTNPYQRGARTMALKAVVDGQVVPNQLVRVGGRTPSGARIPVRRVRTDAAGTVTIPLTPKGSWYAIFIRMVPVAGDSVNYESKWASLTWQVR